MVNNNYLESFKIQVVRRMLSGEHLKVVSQEFGIAKSTLWGWKCKYTPMLAHEFELKEKPEEIGDFIDITKPSRETKEKPALRYVNPSTVTLELGEYRLTFDVTNLDKVLEMLGYDRSK
ncbi:MAG: helix-turn-helix domain containing protein [Bacilli bacterium]|nr:helix-turn-helix domain containing protein [Bacilli bacterium]